VVSRINLKTGTSKAGWTHVVQERFGGKNKSFFGLAQQEVRSLLTSNQVVQTPISRILYDKEAGSDRFDTCATVAPSARSVLRALGAMSAFASGRSTLALGRAVCPA
jgi:hypothetical protein